MKRVILFLTILLGFSFSTIDPLTQKEKNFAAKFLKDTEQGVFDAVNNLTETQLKFKPAEDKWSVEECLKHIAISEKNLWDVVQNALKAPANPEKRTEIKLTDEQVIKGTADRTNKVKTAETFKPENSPFHSKQEALEFFLQNREKLITFVNASSENMRHHIAALPFGSFDAYQLILLISAHSSRHTQQINEVKADPKFPKS